jgi:hypothetical protein
LGPSQYASNISLKNMLEKVWWCRLSKMKIWSWTICCPMNCSNVEKHAQVGGGGRSHVILKCYWKKKMLLLTCAKASKRKGYWSTINLIVMIKIIRAQFLKLLGVMVAISMSPMSSKVIGRKGCFQAKGPSRLLKDLEHKKHPNIWRREK